MRVVVDASALAALIFREESWRDIERKLGGATLCAPDLLRFELANAAVKKARRRPEDGPAIYARLAEGFESVRRIQWHTVDPVDAALLAKVTGLSAYDACYLWLAGWLEADLVTLDKRLSIVAGSASEGP